MIEREIRTHLPIGMPWSPVRAAASARASPRRWPPRARACLFSGATRTGSRRSRSELGGESRAVPVTVDVADAASVHECLRRGAPALRPRAHPDQ